MTRDGKPLRGAKVEMYVSPHPWDAVKTATTDADGRYELDLVRPKDYVLVVKQDAKGTWFDTWAGSTVRLPESDVLHPAAGEVSTADIEVAPAERVTGVVVGTDGKPLAGVDVHADAEHSQLGAHDRTDEDGRYTIGTLPTGRVTVTATAKDGVVTAAASVEVVHGAVAEVTRLELGPAGHLTGTVVGYDDEDGTGVRIEQKGGPGVRAELDGHGRFSLDAAQGSYRVVLGNGVASAWVHLAAGGTASLGTTKAVAGHTTLHGRISAACASGSLESAVYVTDRYDQPSGDAVVHKDGTWSVSGVAAGDYTVASVEAPAGCAGGSTDVHVPTGTSRTIVRLSLDKAYAVRGHVVSQDGSPVVGIVVGCLSGETETDADGDFTCHVGVGDEIGMYDPYGFYRSTSFTLDHASDETRKVVLDR
ncbi:carboxypeptidase-like regulatory domain-containing protein [Cellulomonas sp. HZM]|uniref:carboxypeptidase-like regulatory domain-containing protein n=1 Tax=Cellulomonas sp. HZM TaxID=1454010 RepID=UPI00054F9C94|nr:carboxypeptidase-like regulatory domain-containing protein [Cellulomonas sp. HZM]